MTAGLPVVATAVGGVPEAVVTGKTGILLPPHAPEALARALVTVARDRPLRDEMAEAGRERSTVFDIRSAVEVQQRAYAELVRS